MVGRTLSHYQIIDKLGQGGMGVAYNAYVQAVGYLAHYDIAENVDKAIELFPQAIREDPRYALAHAGLGEAYWRKYQRTTDPPLKLGSRSEFESPIVELYSLMQCHR